ncbi:MAG: hypothetical protein K6G23_05580 [Lachnospiraceae bacterium]|nr:hypothetical protein [Lachnospiraceae bacterium]
MKKRKLLPVFIMLLAGAIASILMAIMRYEITSLLLIVFITLVIFYILGLILMKFLDKVEEQQLQESAEEGEVIEKEADEDVDTDADGASVGEGFYAEGGFGGTGADQGAFGGMDDGTGAFNAGMEGGFGGDVGDGFADEVADNNERF